MRPAATKADLPSTHDITTFIHNSFVTFLKEIQEEIRIYYTLFPCVRTVLEQPAVRWCAVRTLFEQFVLVWQCSNTSNSVRIYYTPFPCVQTVFEQPAVHWCAVQTLFKQFVLVWQCSNTSNSVRTCYTPFPCVRTVFKQPAVCWCAV